MSRQQRRPRIFISYRRADSAGRAGRLKDDLTRLLGDRVFMDVSDIAPGADFEQVLRDELASCGVVLALVGAQWRASFDAPREGPDYVRLELAQALAAPGVQVIPVLMQGADAPAAENLPDGLQALSKRQAVVVRDERWTDDVAHLGRELRVALALPRVRAAWIATAVVALAAPAAWFAFERTPAPAPFSRPRAREIALAATAKAAAACKPARAQAGTCPLVFHFEPGGSASQVYFASGSCGLKAPPFGDCVLQRLATVRIPPFDDLDGAEVGLDLSVQPDGKAQVAVDE